MKEVSSEEFCHIKDQIIEYLVKTAKLSGIQKKLTCFMCNRQTRDNKHNIKDCVQNVDVFIQVDGSLRYTKGTGWPLNTCVKGAHLHQTYAELVDCVMKGNGGTEVVKKFERLGGEGATPCPQCGDVFPTH